MARHVVDRLLAAASACLALSLGPAAHAAPEAEILVGQIVDLSGPGATNGLALSQGANAYFAWYNSLGGANGKRIRVLTQDNRLSPDETVKALDALAKNPNVVAIVNMHGTAGIGAVIKSGVLEQAKLPVVGGLTASSTLQASGNDHLYFIRADIVEEVKAMVQQALLMGNRRFAVVYQDDGYGQDGLNQARAQIEGGGAQLVGVHGFQPGRPDCGATAEAFRKSGAQAIFHFGLGPSVGACIEALRSAGVSALHMAASGSSASSIVAGAGVEKSRGIGVVQVIPDPQSLNLPITREYQKIMKQFGPQGAEPSSFSLEGFIAAKVFVEAIKHAESPYTRAAIAKSLNTMKRIDLGGYWIDFTNGKRGAKYVAIGIITHDGRLAQ